MPDPKLNAEFYDAVTGKRLPPWAVRAGMTITATDYRVSTSTLACTVGEQPTVVHPDDLLISSDVRQLCGGITRHTLIRWRATRGFPEPISARPTGGGQVIEIWDRRDVRAWLEANPL